MCVSSLCLLLFSCLSCWKGNRPMEKSKSFFKYWPNPTWRWVWLLFSNTVFIHFIFSKCLSLWRTTVFYSKNLKMSGSSGNNKVNQTQALTYILTDVIKQTGLVLKWCDHPAVRKIIWRLNPSCALFFVILAAAAGLVSQTRTATEWIYTFLFSNS